jgi:phosphoglycolate phosphatase-like HAD superfamily hydrolase
MLEALEIADRFAAVRYVARKPHPGSLLDALRELGLKPDRSIIYVGDQATDAQAAQNAGIAFAWAEYGYGDGEPDGTDVVLRSAVDIARL